MYGREKGRIDYTHLKLTETEGVALAVTTDLDLNTSEPAEMCPQVSRELVIGLACSQATRDSLAIKKERVE